MSQDQLPWSDSKKWREGYWYPCPISTSVDFAGKNFEIESALWDLFRLDPAFDPTSPLFGDIEPMMIEVTFEQAVEIANRVNPERIFSVPGGAS
jgi:hypothetical protein